MNIINLKKEEIKYLKCEYGFDNKKIDTSDILRSIINKKIKKKIYFFKININNKIMNIDPVPGKKKILFLYFKKKKYNVIENEYIYINIKLSFDIVFKKNINNIDLDKYNSATIFGKGPTFKNIDKNKNELRCAVNQASNIVSNPDFLCMNDHHNIFKINLDTYKNLKYILIPEYLHINTKFHLDGYFVNILEYLNNKFFGKLIIYNLLSSNKRTEYFINLDTARTSGNNIFEFICKFMNIKEVNIYGIGIKSNENYNKLFIGNGIYNDIIIDYIQKVLIECSNKYKVKFILN